MEQHNKAAADAIGSHPLQEILLAAQIPDEDADLGTRDFALLYRAAESGILPFDAVVTILRNICDGGSLVRASRERFDRAMDYLFGIGFRDPELPEVPDDYRDFLDATRRRMGVSDQAFAEMLARAPDGRATPERLTGEGFAYCLYEMFMRQGVPVPALPPRNVMDREAMGRIHAAVTGLGLTFAEHANVLIHVGGGCLRTRDLDMSSAQRVLSRYCSEGWVEPEPAPRIEQRPGYITQPQVNLIWKLSRDIGLPDGEALDGWLSTVAGIDGGLPAVTAAGARYIIDRMMPLAIGIRDMREREAQERHRMQMAEAATAL